MNRGILATITVVLGLAVIGIGFLLFRTDLANVNNSNESDTNATGNINGSTVLTTVSIAKTVTYRGSDFQIDRVERAVTLAGFTPKRGEVFLVVYLQKNLPTFEPSMPEWLATDVQLLDKGGNRYTVAYANVTDPAEDVAGYFAFRVPEPSEDFTLRFVRAEEDVKVDLGL